MPQGFRATRRSINWQSATPIKQCKTITAMITAATMWSIIVRWMVLFGKKNTAQGYSHESSWARGQAWGIYGFTICYRETHDPKYLRQAQKAFEFVIRHKNFPADFIPYWDFDAPKIPNEPRDASAAAIIAAALYELSTYENGEFYKEWGDKIIQSLGSPAYRAKPGENGNFILMHSVGSIPHGAEIDVPLNYADYYFLEALRRRSKQ
jgi:hypothetical protein